MESLAELGEISKANFIGRLTGSTKRVARAKGKLHLSAPAAKPAPTHVTHVEGLAAKRTAATEAETDLARAVMRESDAHLAPAAGRRFPGRALAIGGGSTAAAGGLGYGGYKVATRNKRKEQS